LNRTVDDIKSASTNLRNTNGGVELWGVLGYHWGIPILASEPREKKPLATALLLVIVLVGAGMMDMTRKQVGQVVSFESPTPQLAVVSNTLLESSGALLSVPPVVDMRGITRTEATSSSPLADLSGLISFLRTR
jgi:hypothetical protein